MIRSGISWATALTVLEKQKSNLAKETVRKIEAVVTNWPLSMMLAVDLTPEEAKLVEDAIRKSAEAKRGQ